MMESSKKKSGSVSNCPACKKGYGGEDATLLKASAEQTVIHFTCRKCGISVLVFISSEQGASASIGILTDLDKSDVKNLFQKERITADNVLEVHKYFKDNKLV